MFSFLVLVQLGTILSLIVFFWKDLVAILLATLKSIPALFKRNWDKFSPEARLGWFIVIATIPALIFGYLLKSAVETLFKTPLLEAAIRLLITAVILYFVEWLSKRNRSLTSMTWLDALLIGLAQVLAVFPGASRSGTTIGAGMARGLDRPSAARFAFLMSVPVMLAAGGYQSLDVLKLPGLSAFSAGHRGRIHYRGGNWLAGSQMAAELPEQALAEYLCRILRCDRPDLPGIRFSIRGYLWWIWIPVFRKCSSFLQRFGGNRIPLRR